MGTTLSNIKPDFEDIAQQLRNGLGQRVSWNALLPSETGSVLVESVAAVGAFLRTAVQHTYEERYSDTAKLGSSLKAGARGQGVRLSRKLPGVVQVTLTLPSSPSNTVIPAYSQFSSPSAKLFNRTAIIIPPATTSYAVTLYEGTVYNATIESDGSALQQIWVEVPGFTISDVDVIVTANTQPVRVIQDGMWHYPNVATVENPSHFIVLDQTLPTGELELIFGNDLYGYKPGSNVNISVTYVVTNGSRGNSTSFVSQRVSLAGNNQIVGTATSAIISGADEPPAEQYRISPQMFASYTRAVSMNDHEAIALQYPGIMDAKFLGQRDIAPTVKDYMNVVYVYLLEQDRTQPTAPEFETFKAWLQPKAAPLEHVQQIAIARPVTITANVFIRITGDPNTVKANIEAAVDALFQPKLGYMGKNLYLSDIYDAIKDADANIDFLELLSPTVDTICQISPPVGVTVQPLDVGGSLTAGPTYQYTVSAINALGETFGSQIVQIILAGANDAVQINWQRMPGATGYKVYGRTQADMRQIGATLGANVFTLNDTGAALGVAEQNKVNTSGLYYATKQSLTVNIGYSGRK